MPGDAIPSQIPLTTEKDGVRTIMLYAPILRSKATIEVGVDIDVPTPGFKVSVQVLPPLAELAAAFAPDAAPNALNGRLNGPTAIKSFKDCWAEFFRQVFLRLSASCCRAAA